MPAAPPRAIIALDLLRFACAVLVVAFHYGAAFALAPSATSAALLAGLPVSAGASGATWFGWVGVELFFVISGFVIALSAEGASTRDFLRRRALRLLPAAWLCASATFLVLFLAAPAPELGGRWLRAVSFWPNGSGIDPSYWTLGIELFFYLTIATGLGSCGTLAAIERRALWVGASSAAFWLAALLTGWAATPLMDYRPVQLLLLPHGCCFAIGVGAWGLLSRGATRARLALIALCTATALVEIAGRTAERTHALRISASPLVPMAVFLAGLAVVLGAVRMQPWLARRINAQVAATLGLMTYPLYLVHQEVGAVIVATALRRGVPFFPALGLAFALVLGCAWWVAAVGEPALRGLLARAFSLRRGPSPDTHRSAFPPAG